MTDYSTDAGAFGSPQFDLASASAREQEAFELFKARYKAQNPPPVKPNAVDRKTVGGMFWLYLATSIASVVLASMRTASQFYQAAAANGNPLLGYVEATTAVLAIEGGLVVYAAARAIRRKTVSDRWLVLAIILMVGISMIAGIGQSIHLIDQIDPTVLSYFQYALALLLGAGTSIVAYVGGEVLGQQIILVTTAYEERLNEFEDITKAYNHQMLRSWQTSDERKFARGDLKKAASVTQKFGSSFGSPSEHRIPNGPPRRPPKQRERIFAYMDSQLAEGRIPTVSELVHALGTPKSTASEIRTMWLNDNAVEVSLVNRVVEEVADGQAE